MTETEWADATDPRPMLEVLRTKGLESNRKLRLWMAACCRKVWHVLQDQRSRKGVETAERFADGFADESELYNAEGSAWDAAEDLDGGALAVWDAARAAAWTCYRPSSYSKTAALEAAAEAARAAHEGGLPSKETVAVQTNLLHDIVSNPFRQVRLDPSWLAWNGGTVVRLAQAAYEERVMPAGTLDNARLAVVADALEEAGCTDQEVLGHLREQGGVHVRGCWCVDFLLGKS